MAKCKKCEGWGLVRDPEASDGWARDRAGNGIICPQPEDGGCGGSGVEPAAPAAAQLVDAPGLPEARG